MYKLLTILLFAYGLALTTDDIYDNSYALIIGIDKYENVKPLNYAVKDAESILDILINTFDFPESNITLLLNEDANKQAILKAFSDLTKKAEDNDRVLIYFAGHGETLDLTEGGERGYLLPVDGDKEDLYLSSIGMDELEKISEMSKAKHMLYLVDACYGGIAAIGSRGSRGLDVTSTPNYIEKITRNRAVQIITAGGKDEEVQEKAKWGASAFTFNLKRGLKDGNADWNADGYITANELGLFLQQKVTIDSDYQQTPQYARMTSQEGEFVFVYAENAAVIQSKSADDKLDYLISEMEELKSQKSSDDIVVKKAVDGRQGLYEKYDNKWRTITFVIVEDVYEIGLAESLNNNWFFSIMYINIGDNAARNALNLSSSKIAAANAFSMSLGHLFTTDRITTDRISPFISGGAHYFRTSLKDTERQMSGNKNFINYFIGGGITATLYELNHPFPMFVGMQIQIHCTGLPNSVELIDGILTMDDWKLMLLPQIGFSITIPK